MAHKIIKEKTQKGKEVVLDFFLKRWGVTFNFGKYDLFVGVEGSIRNSRVKRISNTATFMPANH